MSNNEDEGFTVSGFIYMIAVFIVMLIFGMVICKSAEADTSVNVYVNYGGNDTKVFYGVPKYNRRTRTATLKNGTKVTFPKSADVDVRDF